MKNLLSTLAFALISSLLWSSPMTMAANLGDDFDNPYVISNEIDAAPAGMSNRLFDDNDPYVVSNEIMTRESCPNPENQRIAQEYAPFVTLAELREARMNSRC